jgi:recombinational DNA repair protein (RecF pathway)
MKEYVDEAVVLSREPHADADSRVTLFTRRYGKLTARAKSARKITSKLSAHLEPGQRIGVRLVEKNGLQIVDALKKSRVGISPHTLGVLAGLLAEGEPDAPLWELLTQGQFSWADVLGVLGWDPRGALCARCENGALSHFALRRQEFFCVSCIRALKFSVGEVVCIDSDAP